MKITSYIGVDNLLFADTYEVIKNKLTHEFEESQAEFMDKIYPVLFVEDIDLLIQFSEDGSSVRFFEFFKPSFEVYYNEIDLSRNYQSIFKSISMLDTNIQEDEDGFTTNKLGITINREEANNTFTNDIEGILVFSKEYAFEEEEEPDDFLKFHLGYNPFDGHEN